MIIDEEISLQYIDLIKTLNITTSIEVGAFNAEYSQIAVIEKICPNIWAFEASPYVFQRFRDILPEEIKYRQMAISNFEGELEFEFQSEYQDPGSVSNNSIMRRNEDKSYTYEKVYCASLDFLFKDGKDERISLWIDAEGANKEVLTGADKLLDSVVSIFIETEHKDFWKDGWLHADVESYLNSKGFKMIAQKEQYGYQTNCIFIKDQDLHQ